MTLSQRYKTLIIIILLSIGIFLIFGLDYFYDENEEVTELVKFIGQGLCLTSLVILLTVKEPDKKTLDNTQSLNKVQTFTNDQLLINVPHIEQTTHTINKELENKKNEKTDIHKRLDILNSYIENHRKTYLLHSVEPNEKIYNQVRKSIGEYNELKTKLKSIESN